MVQILLVDISWFILESGVRIFAQEYCSSCPISFSNESCVDSRSGFSLLSASRLKLHFMAAACDRGTVICLEFVTQAQVI